MSVQGAAKLVHIPSDDSEGIEQHELMEIAVGKDVLELVSSAMHFDPMTAYREYVQNAADAVDTARAAGAITADVPGRVDIVVDTENRTVRIRDNGCGVPFPEFGRKLTRLGGSAKRGTSARGFRGVGRLAGLGYAQELVFRSRVADERKVSELRWDCRGLRAALREAGNDAGVADLIRDVTTLRRLNHKDAPERFFEVELRGMVRLRDDRLMSPPAISEYLSQVAPVPFSSDFQFGREWTNTLSRHLDLGILDICVSGMEQPVYRPHRDSYRFDDKPDITFNELTVVEIPGVDHDVAAVACILHHEYDGAVPTGTLVRGLRLRTGNIQVGDHKLLEELFPEPRFNAWSVGEVHVLDRRIVPNGRRDNFEQNAHLHNLLNHLSPMVRDITRRCRTSSVRRKWERDFELHHRTVKQKLAILEQGGLSTLDRQALVESVGSTLRQMDSIAAKHLPADGRTQQRADIVHTLRNELANLEADVSVPVPLARMDPDTRAMYEQIFALIYECSTNRAAAKALVERILDKLHSMQWDVTPIEDRL